MTHPTHSPMPPSPLPDRGWSVVCGARSPAERGRFLSWNDPGKNPDGPPDLDELWRDFNRRLSGLFSGNPGGANRNGGGTGTGGGEGPSPRQAWLGIGAVAAALFLIWMGTGIYTVQAGQVAVVSTFGRFVGTVGPGLHWRMPWPIQANDTVDVYAQRKVDIGMHGDEDRLKEALMLTDDENVVDVQFEVQYRVKSGPDGARDYVYGSRFTPNARDGDPSAVVKQAAESAMREVVGRRTMDAVLFGSREEIAAEVRKELQDMLDRYRTGLLVTAVAIQNAQPPDPVQSAFDDASKAVQDKDRQINEGEAYANSVVPRARGDAARLVQEAEGYEVRVVDTAEGDAVRFRKILAAYVKAPRVTRERMYIDAMRDIFANTSKVMIDTRNSAPLLYLPLDRLLRQSSAGESTAPSGAPSAAGDSQADGAAAAGQPQSDSRSDDTDSRNRESR